MKAFRASDSTDKKMRASDQISKENGEQENNEML
jgi:hypothetical protein